MKNIFRKSVAMFIAIMMIVTSVPFSSAVTAQAEIARYTIGTKSKGVFTNGSNRWKGNNTVNIVNDSTNDAFSIGFINFDISDIPNIDDSYAVKSNYTFDLVKGSGCEEFIPLHISYPTQNQSLFYNQSTPTGTDTEGNNLSRIDSTAFNAIYKSGYHDNAVDYFGLKDLRVCRANSDYSRSTVTIDIGVAIKNAKMAGLNYATVVFMLAWGDSTTGGSNGWSDTHLYFGDDSIDVALRQADKTKTINVSQFEQTHFSDGTKDGFGILKSTAGNSRLKDDKRLVIVNDAQNDNFDIGYVTFDVSELAGQNVKLSHAYYTFNTQRDHNEDLGIKLFYPTLNEDTFYRAGEWTDGSTAIWPESGGNNNFDSNTVTWDHMREAKRNFGFVEIDTIPSISSSVTSQTIDIYRAIQWAINNGRSTAVVCFMIAKHGGVGEKDLNGNGNNWSDVLVTITNKSVDINYASDNTLQAFTAKTANSYGTFESDSGSYTSAYNNCLYAPTGMGATYESGSVSAEGRNKVYVNGKFYYGNVVLMYDGITTPQLGVGFGLIGVSKPWNYNYNNIRAFRANLINTSGLSLVNNRWKGSNASMNYYDIMTNRGDSIGTTSDNENRQGEKGFYGNFLQYTGGKFSSNYIKINPTFEFVTKTDEGSQQTHSTGVINNGSVYVINYRKVVDRINEARAHYNSLDKSLYGENSLNEYVLAINSLQLFDPNSYSYSSDVAAAVQQAGSDIDTLISAVDTAKNNLQYRFVFRHYDGDTETVAAKVYDNFNDSYNEALAKLKVRQSAPTYSIIDGNNTQHNKTTYSWQRGANIVTYSEIGLPSPESCSFGSETQIGETVEPTCTQDGQKIWRKTCSVCGHDVDRTEVLPATDHDIEYTSSTIYKHTVTCTRGDLNDTADHEFGDDGVCTKCGFHKVDEDAYNAAVIVLEAELARTYLYTAESIESAQTALDEANDSKPNCTNQDELDVLTQRITTATNSLAKKQVNIRFVKNVDNVETEISNEVYYYGDQQTFELDATDVSVLKWTVETADGTSLMNSTLSTVKYVPYSDATIIVYAERGTSSENPKDKQVVFRTLNGSVQEIRYVETFDEIGGMPVANSYPFYSFKEWSEPKYSDDGNVVYYDAVYEFSGNEADQCGIHFTYKGETKPYEYDSFVKLDGLDSSKTYALSTTDNESGIITYIRGNAFYAPHADNVYVVECAGKPVPMIGITGDYSVINTDKRGIAVNSKYYLPNGAVKVEAGFDVVMVKTTDERSSVTRIKCPNVNAYSEYTKTFTTRNTSIAAFEITPYVIYTFDGDQIELKGSSKTYNL